MSFFAKVLHTFAGHALSRASRERQAAALHTSPCKGEVEIICFACEANDFRWGSTAAQHSRSSRLWLGPPPGSPRHSRGSPTSPLQGEVSTPHRRCYEGHHVRVSRLCAGAA